MLVTLRDVRLKIINLSSQQFNKLFMSILQEIYGELFEQ